jgi:hypothetical protein
MLLGYRLHIDVDADSNSAPHSLQRPSIPLIPSKERSLTLSYNSRCGDREINDLVRDAADEVGGRYQDSHEVLSLIRGFNHVKSWSVFVSCIWLAWLYIFPFPPCVCVCSAASIIDFLNPYVRRGSSVTVRTSCKIDAACNMTFFPLTIDLTLGPGIILTRSTYSVPRLSRILGTQGHDTWAISAKEINWYGPSSIQTRIPNHTRIGLASHHTFTWLQILDSMPNQLVERLRRY